MRSDAGNYRGPSDQGEFLSTKEMLRVMQFVPQERIPKHTLDELIDVPVAHVMTSVPKEWTQECIAKEIIDVNVAQLMEEICGVVKFTPQLQSLDKVVHSPFPIQRQDTEAPMAKISRSKPEGTQCKRKKKKKGRGESVRNERKRGKKMWNGRGLRKGG